MPRVRYNAGQYNPGAAAMFMKIIILLFLLTILYSLASSFVFLVLDKGQGDRMVKRLTWRIGLSLLLFVLLWGAYQMGWVESKGKGPVRISQDIQADQ
jgi:succinate dehydrogenase/fumarate reductase cytochrome b subunit